MTQIIPAILATTEQEYAEKINKVNKSPSFQEGWVQIDLMDKKFVENESIRPDVFAKYPTNLKIEAQLMVEYPLSWIDGLAEACVSRIVFPFEVEPGIEERISRIKKLGIDVGLSINPETPVENLKPFVSRIDLVLIMSVQPGFGGQSFIDSSTQKVKDVFRLRQDLGLDFLIEVDGGINESAAKDLVQAGADNLVIGSSLLNGDIEENVEHIWEAIQS